MQWNKIEQLESGSLLIMKTTGILFFLAGLAAAFCQGAEELDGNNKTAVCFKNDMVATVVIYTYVAYS
jgi:hypothetical protein